MWHVCMRVSRVTCVYDTHRVAQEFLVAQRSYSRLREIAAELALELSHGHAHGHGHGHTHGVPAEAGAIADMSCQVADILVMMRPDDEPPSDFQASKESHDSILVLTVRGCGPASCERGFSPDYTLPAITANITL
jgi:hypothetical protein